jgi:hypothetical protein
VESAITCPQKGGTSLTTNLKSCLVQSTIVYRNPEKNEAQMGWIKVQIYTTYPPYSFLVVYMNKKIERDGVRSSK